MQFKWLARHAYETRCMQCNKPYVNFYLIYKNIYQLPFSSHAPSTDSINIINLFRKANNFIYSAMFTLPATAAKKDPRRQKKSAAKLSKFEKCFWCIIAITMRTRDKSIFKLDTFCAGWKQNFSVAKNSSGRESKMMINSSEIHRHGGAKKQARESERAADNYTY